jgi:hypothetical protein
MSAPGGSGLTGLAALRYFATCRSVGRARARAGRGVSKQSVGTHLQHGFGWGLGGANHHSNVCHAGIPRVICSCDAAAAAPTRKPAAPACERDSPGSSCHRRRRRRSHHPRLRRSEGAGARTGATLGAGNVTQARPNGLHGAASKQSLQAASRPAAGPTSLALLAAAPFPPSHTQTRRRRRRPLTAAAARASTLVHAVAGQVAGLATLWGHEAPRTGVGQRRGMGPGGGRQSGRVSAASRAPRHGEAAGLGVVSQGMRARSKARGCRRVRSPGSSCRRRPHSRHRRSRPRHSRPRRSLRASKAKGKGSDGDSQPDGTSWQQDALRQ